MSPTTIKDRILSLYQASLQLGCVPKLWKKAKIIMIHKSGKSKEELTSYRPILLLICLSKLFEKIINKKITTWAESNNLYPQEQSGTAPKEAATTTFFAQQITDGFNANKWRSLELEITGAVFFYLEKAFDIAPHNGIINKLEKYNLNNNFIVHKNDHFCNI